LTGRRDFLYVADCKLGPIMEMESVSIIKTAAHGVAGLGTRGSAHRSTLLGTS
jgi:hypothetical protein